MDYKDRPQLSGFAAPHTPALTELPHAQLNAVWLSGITSQTELQSRVQFDEMMFRLSKTFIDLPVDPIDSELNNGLKALADVLDLDRVSINLLDSDKKSRTITHSWAGPGIPLSIKPYLERFQRALGQSVLSSIPRHSEEKRWSTTREYPDGGFELRNRSPEQCLGGCSQVISH
jgi:hypothetical protein